MLKNIFIFKKSIKISFFTDFPALFRNIVYSLIWEWTLSSTFSTKMLSKDKYFNFMIPEKILEFVLDT